MTAFDEYCSLADRMVSLSIVRDSDPHAPVWLLLEIADIRRACEEPWRKLDSIERLAAMSYFSDALHRARAAGAHNVV